MVRFVRLFRSSILLILPSLKKFSSTLCFFVFWKICLYNFFSNRYVFILPEHLSKKLYAEVSFNHVQNEMTHPTLFYCPNCSRSYKYKNNLTVHLKLECGKSPQYKCDVCGKSYTRRGTLKTHMGLAHGILMSKWYNFLVIYDMSSFQVFILLNSCVLLLVLNHSRKFIPKYKHIGAIRICS